MIAGNYKDYADYVNQHRILFSDVYDDYDTEEDDDCEGEFRDIAREEEMLKELKNGR
jgi:hypothetical protein